MSPMSVVLYYDSALEIGKGENCSLCASFARLNTKPMISHMKFG